jgi:hypothetical protein
MDVEGRARSPTGRRRATVIPARHRARGWEVLPVMKDLRNAQERL